MSRISPHMRLSLQLQESFSLSPPSSKHVAKAMMGAPGHRAHFLENMPAYRGWSDVATRDLPGELEEKASVSGLHLIPACFVKKCGRRLAIREDVQRNRALSVNSHTMNTCQQFRFRTCTEERKYWLHVAARVEPSKKRFLRMLSCGSSMMIKQSKCRGGQVRAELTTCENRFCPACCLRKGHKRSERITNLLRLVNPNWLKFITLTLRHSKRPLVEQIKHLRKAFRALRRAPLWKETMIWGTAVIEVKLNSSGEWHPHLHIIAVGDYYPQEALSEDWGKATRIPRSTCPKCQGAGQVPPYHRKDKRGRFYGEKLTICPDCHGHGDERSVIIDIRAVRDREQSIKYCAKYVAKPCTSNALKNNLIAGCELYLVMDRAKTCWLWGDKNAIPTKPEQEQEPEELRAEWDDWETILTWRDIVHGLACGDHYTSKLCEATGVPVNAIINWHIAGLESPP